MTSATMRNGTHLHEVRVGVEKELGITQRCAPVNFAWSGDIRKRYTDFLVYEINKDGSVLHLHDYPEEEVPVKASQHAGQTERQSAPAPAPAVKPTSENDRKILVNLAGCHVTDELVELDDNIQRKNDDLVKGKEITFLAVKDRAIRKTIHFEVRRIFASRIDTSADANGVIKASRSTATGRNRHAPGPRQPKQDHDGSTGEYLHLTLYKENKDTMDAINTIARVVRIKASNFAFAGTKDRRAATVQRISIYHMRPNNMIWMNSRLPGIRVGDFKFENHPLSLGQHGGNEFVIVLKNCTPLGAPSESGQRVHKIREALEMALAYLKARGYINYYGLQRFGTHTIGTHLLGVKILSGDYAGAIQDILHVDEYLVEKVVGGTPADVSSNNDDFHRARAITTWKMTNNAQAALDALPKRFSSEAAIIRHLGNPVHKTDFQGAILTITRGMRMMYIHAYQSYVWNHVASRRWSLYGPVVIEGDLVIVDSGMPDHQNSDVDEVLKNNFEEDHFYAQAKALTAEDVARGKYTIFDVVLPTPGYDVVYPNNDIGQFYVDFMARPGNGGLSPYDMRRPQREFSLSGNYRPLLGRFIGDPEYCIRKYSDDMQQMYPTDLNICMHNKAKANNKAAGASNDAAKKDDGLSQWQHFAANPKVWDQALAKRRAADEPSPPSNTVVRTTETWVQTGLDNNDHKRVKLTRQTFESERTLERSSDSTGASNTVAAGPSTTQDTPIPGASAAVHTNDPHNWFGNMMPTVSAAPAPATPVAEEAKEADTTIGGITMPVLRTVSDNPIQAHGSKETTPDSTDASEGDKIAVILKFQLKTSNYATVVLRELMGSVPSDEVR